jgi:hypothetical protein
VRILGHGLPEPHPGAGLAGWDQQRPAFFQGRDDLGCRRGVEVMAPVLEVPDGAARDVRACGEFLLGPVQEATGGTALLGGEWRHSGCSGSDVKLPIMVESRPLLAGHKRIGQAERGIVPGSECRLADLDIRDVAGSIVIERATIHYVLDGY